MERDGSRSSGGDDSAATEKKEVYVSATSLVVMAAAAGGLFAGGRHYFHRAEKADPEAEKGSVRRVLRLEECRKQKCRQSLSLRLPWYWRKALSAATLLTTSVFALGCLVLLTTGIYRPCRIFLTK